MVKTAQVRSNIILDAFIIMPNHIHGIIVLETTQRVVSTGKNCHTIQSGSLGSIIGQFKSKVTKRINTIGYDHIIWQPRFYEHIIRNEEDLMRIRQYIENNPKQWPIDKENPLSK